MKEDHLRLSCSEQLGVVKRVKSQVWLVGVVSKLSLAHRLGWINSPLPHIQHLYHVYIIYNQVMVFGNIKPVVMLKWVWPGIGHHETDRQLHTQIQDPQRTYALVHYGCNIRRICRQRIPPSLSLNYPEKESQTVSKGSSPSSAVTSHLLSPLTAVQAIGPPYYEVVLMWTLLLSIC